MTESVCSAMNVRNRFFVWDFLISLMCVWLEKLLYWVFVLVVFFTFLYSCFVFHCTKCHVETNQKRWRHYSTLWCYICWTMLLEERSILKLIVLLKDKLKIACSYLFCTRLVSEHENFKTDLVSEIILLNAFWNTIIVCMFFSLNGMYKSGYLLKM